MSRDGSKSFVQSRNEVPAMFVPEISDERFEISPRFRQSLENRIARLERDAAHDESQVSLLAHPDHIRRQLRLVAAERTEALRMRLFLDRSRPRLARPVIV